jgi:hypothetical protein
LPFKTAEERLIPAIAGFFSPEKKYFHLKISDPAPSGLQRHNPGTFPYGTGPSNPLFRKLA